jgi:NACHT domain
LRYTRTFDLQHHIKLFSSFKLRGTIDYDSWAEKLKLIKSEESELFEKFRMATSGINLEQTTNIAQNTRELVDISRKQEQHQVDAKNQKYLGYLNATDPSLDKRRIQETKGSLLGDSYRWVLDNPDFIKWRDSKQGQLLWIRGDPGKGKTMLLCGIINELTKPKSTDQLLSYFFCQATDSRLNNASAVLRGLIYMLVRKTAGAHVAFEEKLQSD